MPKFRKKPVVVEAEKIYSYHDIPRISEWVNGNGGKSTYGQQDDGPAELLISTLEGVMTAKIGDIVIRGVKGEFYPCKEDIFMATYDLVE